MFRILDHVESITLVFRASRPLHQMRRRPSKWLECSNGQLGLVPGLGAGVQQVLRPRRAVRRGRAARRRTERAQRSQIGTHCISKLWEALSRLYKFLQTKTHFSALHLFEIFKVYTYASFGLHTFAPLQTQMISSNILVNIFRVVFDEFVAIPPDIFD